MTRQKTMKAYPYKPEDMNNTDNKPFEWDDKKVKELIYRHFPSHSVPLQPILDTFKLSHSTLGEEKGRDWQVESFTTNDRHCRLLRKPNGKFGEYDSEEKDFLSSSFHSIYSVRRTSDSVVFSIGDVINKGKIEKFALGTFLGLLIQCNGCAYDISEIQKAPEVKEPLLTTQDGIIKYEGDNVYNVDTKEDHWNVGSWYSLPKPLRLEGLGGKQKDLSGYKYFHTSEAAEEWILMNKPCFSIKEIDEALSLSGAGIHTLKQLASSKLNKDTV